MKDSPSIYKKFVITSCSFAFCGVIISASYAQTPFHQVSAALDVHPAGPGSVFTVALSMQPADVNISGFSFEVAYDNTQVTLLSASDNTGQGSTAAPAYTLGNEMSISGVDHVNVFKPLIMDTAMDLYTPAKLVLLTFQATSGYSNPSNKVWLHLEDWGVHGGLLDGMDDDNAAQPIPTTYLNAVSEEVPVSLSGFTLE